MVYRGSGIGRTSTRSQRCGSAVELLLVNLTPREPLVENAPRRLGAVANAATFSCWPES